MGSDIPEYAGSGWTGQSVLVQQPDQVSFNNFVASLPGGGWTAVGLQYLDPITNYISQRFVRYIQWPQSAWWTLPLPYQNPPVARNRSFIGCQPWFGLGNGWVNNR